MRTEQTSRAVFLTYVAGGSGCEEDSHNKVSFEGQNGLEHPFLSASPFHVTIPVSCHRRWLSLVARLDRLLDRSFSDSDTRESVRPSSQARTFICELYGSKTGESGKEQLEESAQ